MGSSPASGTREYKYTRRCAQQRLHYPGARNRRKENRFEVYSI